MFDGDLFNSVIELVRIKDWSIKVIFIGQFISALGLRVRERVLKSSGLTLHNFYQNSVALT